MFAGIRVKVRIVALSPSTQKPEQLDSTLQRPTSLATPVMRNEMLQNLDGLWASADQVNINDELVEVLHGIQNVRRISSVCLLMTASLYTYWKHLLFGKS